MGVLTMLPNNAGHTNPLYCETTNLTRMTLTRNLNYLTPYEVFRKQCGALRVECGLNC